LIGLDGRLPHSQLAPPIANAIADIPTTTAMDLRRWHLVDLPTNTDSRGSITICESGAQIDFVMKRARWVYGAPSDVTRGGHGHHRTTQLFIAVNGALTITVDDGERRERHRLESPGRGLYISPLVWIETSEFSTGTVLLMLASEPHDPADYIRDYGALAEAAARGRGSGRSAIT
jgi:dTDP-4-dehydrorhamnose 3,5-epimerase-like enzyme